MQKSLHFLKNQSDFRNCPKSETRHCRRRKRVSSRRKAYYDKLTKLTTQAYYPSLLPKLTMISIKIHVVPYCIILKMAMTILKGFVRHFKKMNTGSGPRILTSSEAHRASPTTLALTEYRISFHEICSKK